MDRKFFLDLAAGGLRMPIGTDLLLREQPGADEILLDGGRLGRVVEQAARRFGTPLAVPLMDLTVEKAQLLAFYPVPPDQVDSHHFTAAPTPADSARVKAGIGDRLHPRLRANADAVAWIAGHTALTPMGMCIGPFSLTTKLLADPITPVFLAGQGLDDSEPEVALLRAVLALAETVVQASLRVQMDAGARVVIVCEPAANQVYLSPRQMAAGAPIFEDFVMAPLRRLRALLAARDVDLFLHDCGELTDAMLTQLAGVDPAILSLGSSRVLWEDARLVPRSTVLYGNLPSKKFYSDEVITREQVRQRGTELLTRMRQADHPFILGTECDVLSVPGCEAAIRAKVDAMLEA